MTNAYAHLPDYADLAYVDRKLRVARTMLRRQCPEVRQRWLEIADILLDQRAALAEIGGDAR